MPRVIDADVQEILETNLDCTPFILAANILVNKVLGASGLDEAHLKEIERWLAAHFTCMMDPHEREAQADTARSQFEGAWGLGLDHTRYGQQVKILDTTGLLSATAEVAAANVARRTAAVRTVTREE